MGHVVALDRLSRYSRSLWQRLAPELPAEAEWSRCGTLWVAEKPGQLETRDLTGEVLDAAALRQAEPELAHDLVGAIRVAEDAVLYPSAAARWMVERSGAAMHYGLVSRMDSRGVVLDDGRVIAAGQVLDATAFGLLAPLPIVPRKGHLLITVRHPDFCRHQLVELGYMASAHGRQDCSVAFNLQPRVTGQLLLGSSRQLGVTDPQVEPAILRRMIKRAERFVPRLGSLTALRSWTGFRPCTQDGQPLIGRLSDRLLVAAGHEGLGVTTATGTARLLADILLDRPSEIDRTPYAPQRLMAHV